MEAAVYFQLAVLVKAISRFHMLQCIQVYTDFEDVDFPGHECINGLEAPLFLVMFR